MHHRHTLGSLFALGLTIASTGVLGLVAAQPAAAWPGNVVIDYKAPNGAIQANLQNLLPLAGAQQPAPLSSTFDHSLAQNTSAICATIEKQFQQQVNSAGDGPLSNWSCSLPGSGNLEAAQLGPNEVGLHYSVPNTSVSFDVNATTNPTIHATFTLELSLALTFANQIGGYYEQPDPPLTVASSQLTIPYADVWSNNWFVSQEDVHKIWSALTSYTLSPALSMLNLGPEIENLNTQLGEIGDPFSRFIALDGSWCGPACPSLPNGSEASSLFDLSVTADANNLNLVFSHGALPPQPTGCAFGASSSTPPAEIYAECSPNQPGGIEWLFLRQEINGAWNRLTEVGPGTIMGAPQVGSAPTVDVTVCGWNEWGGDCLPPTAFTLQVNRVSYDWWAAERQAAGSYGSPAGSYIPPNYGGGGSGVGGGSSPGTVHGCGISGCHMM